jgi:hypothetical protein
MFHRTATALATIVAGFAGCAGSSNGSQRAASAPPPYASHAAELFDDVIEPEAVGYDLDRAPTPMTPMNSNRLRERAQVGDAVVRAHVTTVTSKDEDTGQTWQIGLHTIETLAGSRSPPADFTVQIQNNGPSAGIVRAFEGRLIGKTFVAFVREFAAPGIGGDTDLHFHLAPDARPELAAVEAAVRMDQVR